MPREYNIKWNENQRAKLNSAARKYNNAIRKEKRNNPLAAEFLPKEVSYKDLKNAITNRRALKNTVNSLTRGTKPKALNLVRQNDGSIVTNYERHEYAILKSVRERKKSMRAKKNNLMQPGSGIGTLEQAKLTPDTRKVSDISSTALKRFIDTQEREINRSSQENAQRYFSNYQSALQTVFGDFEDFDERIANIEEKILKLAASDFDALKDAIDLAPSIRYIYDPVSRVIKIENIEEYWNKLDV